MPVNTLPEGTSNASFFVVCDKRDDIKRYICEFIGTYTLVFFAAGAVVVSASMEGTLGAIGGGLISGLVLMVIIFAFAHVSGGRRAPPCRGSAGGSA